MTLVGLHFIMCFVVDHIPSGDGHEGITIALLERDHDGLKMGPRHDPLVASFMNGSVKVNYFLFTYEISMFQIIFYLFTYVNSTGTL